MCPKSGLSVVLAMVPKSRVLHCLAQTHAAQQAGGRLSADHVFVIDQHIPGNAAQVALYCGEVEEGPLLQYLATARDPLGRPLYDAQYALRLARQRDRVHASVALFCELSMYEVGLAWGSIATALLH